jgi:hypothetical protein
MIEGNAKFQVEFSENIDEFSPSPIQIDGPPEIYPRTAWGSVGPRLRTPALK